MNPRRWWWIAPVAVIILLSTSALADSVWVKSRYAKVREGQSVRTSIVGTPGYGEELTLLRSERGYCEVELASGDKGWISRVWVSTHKPEKRNKALERLGREGRDGSTSVGYTAGSRGLSPTARRYADKNNLQDAVLALERMEGVRIPDKALDGFMKRGGLGPWRGEASE